jgi:hypothetical protein
MFCPPLKPGRHGGLPLPIPLRPNTGRTVYNVSGGGNIAGGIKIFKENLSILYFDVAEKGDIGWNNGIIIKACRFGESGSVAGRHNPGAPGEGAQRKDAFYFFVL